MGGMAPFGEAVEICGPTSMFCEGEIDGSEKLCDGCFGGRPCARSALLKNGIAGNVSAYERATMC